MALQLLAMQLKPNLAGLRAPVSTPSCGSWAILLVCTLLAAYGLATNTPRRKRNNNTARLKKSNATGLQGRIRETGWTSFASASGKSSDGLAYTSIRMLFLRVATCKSI